MSTPAIVTAWNFRPPINTAIVDAKGVTTSPETVFRTNLQKLLQAAAVVNVASFGAKGNGSTDDTQAFIQAVNQATNLGGGIVGIPAGSFPINLLPLPASTPPITFIGQGKSTKLIRNGTVASGHGMIDIYASDIALQNLVIDGATTKATGLEYGGGFSGVETNDPMAASLTTNTSVWVHGGAQRISFYRCMFQHAGGYSILLDATTGQIVDIDILNSWFCNNRPTLFGTNPSDLNYGSWNGGILAMGDGRTSDPNVVSDLLVAQCRFGRNTGNCVWSSLYGLNALHSEFRISTNRFLDCGLDGIEIGGVIGGVVEGNVLRRVGYVCVDDTSQSVPRWLANLNATAIDSSGLVIGVNYQGNSITSVNGGGLDLDGHCDSSISGNLVRIPVAGELAYTEDQIAITGSSNSGSTSYGLNFNNTNQTPWGAQNVDIGDNTFLNLPAGSLRLYAARWCHIHGNTVNAPAASIVPPISMGPVGSGPYQRCYNNRICHNHALYSPASSAPVVFEDDSYSAFLNTEENYVFGNVPIIGNGMAYEFEKSINSGSTVYAQTVWFP